MLSDHDEIELKEIHKNQSIRITDLPVELTSIIQSHCHYALAVTCLKFFRQKEMDLPILAPQYFKDLLQGRHSLQNHEEAVGNLRLIGACISYFSSVFEDERLKLAWIGVLMLELFQTLHKLTELDSLTFTLPKMVRHFRYIPAAQGVGVYQWEDKEEAWPIETNNLLELIQQSSVFLDIVHDKDKTTEVNDLLPTIQAFNNKLIFSLEEASRTQRLPRLATRFYALFNPKQHETEADKILRLCTFALNQTNVVLKVIDLDHADQYLSLKK